MTSPWSRSLSVLVICVFACVVVKATHYPSTEYVKNHCGNRYIVDGDLIVKLTSSINNYLESHTTCKVNLVPRTGRALVARVIKYDMSFSEKSFSSNSPCNQQAVLLTDSFGQSVWGTNGYCQMRRPTDQYYLGTSGQFGYRTGTGLLFDLMNRKAAEVSLLVTEVWTTNATGSCPSDTFDCNRQDLCVADDVTCNGYNDCSNNEDEIEGCGLTAGIIAGIVIGVIAFIAIVIVVVVLCIKFH